MRYISVSYQRVIQYKKDLPFSLLWIVFFSVILLQTADAQINRDKVLFIAIGDTEDLLRREHPEKFKFKIGEECKQSIANVEMIARSIPGLRTKTQYFSGNDFSKNALMRYLQNETFGQEMDSAAVVILYLISHGEADTSLTEELPIVHFPDGKLRTVDLRNSLLDDGSNQLIMLVVEACNHEPVFPNDEITLKSGDEYSAIEEAVINNLFLKNSGYVEMVSSKRSYKSYVTEKGGLLAFYLRNYILNSGKHGQWDSLSTYLTRNIYNYELKSDSLITLTGNKIMKVENFQPYINLDFLLEEDE
ncbi:MAG: caspase family protein [Cyclobacteriaceae bacterium]